jgi:hypothetical protein
MIRRKVALVLGLAIVFMANSIAVQAGHKQPTFTMIQGAGNTFVAGGTGSPGFVPVVTKLGIFWDGTHGTLDCLALAPSHSAGSSQSGNFDTNIMYVTAEITSVVFHGNTAILTGTANCTGLGAGTGVPFTATVTSGGPGTRVVLVVSGLTFVETLLDGQIVFL